MFLCFIDLRKEYGIADRALLQQVLAGFGVTPEIFAVIRRLFQEGVQVCARSYSGECLEGFEVGQGLREGCLFSPLLFKVFSAAVLIIHLQMFT